MQALLARQCGCLGAQLLGGQGAWGVAQQKLDYQMKTYKGLYNLGNKFSECYDLSKIFTIANEFVNEKQFLKHKFYWQEGYGAFSYSHSALDSVIAYINNQKEHHKKQSFREEYTEFLKKFQLEYKDEYLFKWIE